MGKIKKTNSRTFTAADRTSIRDVITILKSVRHHVASRRIRDFLEVFFMFFFQYKMLYLVVNKKKNSLFRVKVG